MAREIKPSPEGKPKPKNLTVTSWRAIGTGGALTTMLYGVVHANPVHPEYLEELLQALIAGCGILAFVGMFIGDKPTNP